MDREMKRIYVDYTRLGNPDELTQFAVSLLPRDRRELVPGEKVILECDAVPDYEATFVEFLDEHRGLFSLVPVAGTARPATTSDRSL